MLGSFIRLVDYMMIEALVDRTIGTVEELVAMLEAPRQSADKTHKVSCVIMPSDLWALPHCKVHGTPSCIVWTSMHMLHIRQQFRRSGNTLGPWQVL